MPLITGIAHVELSVTDLDRSVEWYCRLLGARDVFRAANAERGFNACAIFEPQSKLVLAFTAHDRETRVPFSPLQPGLDHISFAVADRSAIDEWVAYLDALDIAHDPIDDQGFAVAVNLRDPDGIALEFYWLNRKR